MKIVRPICCGMDVHKNIIVATIGITNKKTRITEYIQETFSTLNPDCSYNDILVNIHATADWSTIFIKKSLLSLKEEKWH